MGDRIEDTVLQGIRLPVGWLDKHLSSRGITAREFSALCSVSEQTLSSARLSRRISPRTLTLIHMGLEKIPVILPEALAG